MLISVFRDNRADFDALLGFYTKWKNPATGLMGWRVRQGDNDYFYQDKNQGDTNSATDGDLDVAYALLLAGRLPHLQIVHTGKSWSACALSDLPVQRSPSCLSVLC